MKINSIKINNFGKLKNFPLSLEDGFNVLYGENEQGKSTIMAFIRMMFYGTATRGSDLTKNMRKKYTPWDGAKMSGSMEFSHEGISYRLEKAFGSTPKNDTVKLWNISTNEAVQMTEQREIGRRFLGLGEDAFEKSVFIGQIGSVINTEKEKESEIIQKLQNLASSGDETQSYNLVDSRIQSAIEKIKSRSGKIGILDRLQQVKYRLEEQKADAIHIESEKTKMYEEYNELIAIKEKSEKILGEKIANHEIIQQYKEYQDLQMILNKNKEINILAKELDDTNAILTNGDFKVDMYFLEESKKRLLELQKKHSILKNKIDEIKAKGKSINFVDGNKNVNICKEEFESINILYKQLTDEKELAGTMQLSMQHYLYQMKEAIQSETIRTEAASKITEYRKQIEDLSKKLNQPKEILPVKPAKPVMFPILAGIVCTALIIMVIIAGYIVHPVFYAGVVIPVIILLISLINYSKNNKKQNSDSANANNIINAENELVNSNIVFIQNLLNEQLQKQQNVSQDLNASDGDKKKTVDEIRDEIEKTRESMAENQKSMDLKQSKINEKFVQFEVSSFDEFRDKYMQTQSVKDQKSTAARAMWENLTDFESQAGEFDKELNMFNEYFGKIKSSVNIDFPLSTEINENIGAEINNSVTTGSDNGVATGMKSYDCDYILNSIKNKIAEYDKNLSIYFIRTEDVLKEIKDIQNDLTQKLFSSQSISAMLDDKKKDIRYELNARPLSVIQQNYEVRKRQYENGDFKDLNTGISKDEISRIENEIESYKNSINLLTLDLAQMKSDMSQTFIDKPELATIVDLIELNEQQQIKYQDRFASLEMAKKQMEQAFLEMQLTFGPIVNTKTADIFSRITNGKYNELLVTKDLNINFRDPLLNTTQEWQYLSGGTIDQVYFSLRLAISGLLAEQVGGLPLFIDDAFLQYDDNRTKQSLLFLEDYAKTKHAQILFFTCHQAVWNMCGDNVNKIELSEK